ncbi:MAG TPA: VWA domain-containing protein [Fibrobacteria bacterium]|nr:VWA domain-containing protein [Fibrobacteria bacterium]
MSQRRLPVYLLLDTSGSMIGEPIEAVNVGLQTMLSALRTDPMALEAAYLSLVTFDSTVQEILPLTPLDEVVLPPIECPKSGATMLGAALARIEEKVAAEVRKTTPDQKGDWRPLLFLLTDGKASDSAAWQRMIPRIKACGFSRIVACAAGPKADPDVLRALTDDVVVLATMHRSEFTRFFRLVSSTVTLGSRGPALLVGGTDQDEPEELPEPPEEINPFI